MLNLEEGDIFIPKKLDIKNFKQVSLFSSPNCKTYASQIKVSILLFLYSTDICLGLVRVLPSGEFEYNCVSLFWGWIFFSNSIKTLPMFQLIKVCHCENLLVNQCVQGGLSMGLIFKCQTSNVLKLIDK